MGKYNFFELKQKYHDKPLPEDVNDLADVVAGKLHNGEELVEALKKAREKKIFGKIIHYDKIEVNGMDVTIDSAVFKFRYGIVQEFIVKKLVDHSNIEERNVINNKVNFKKTLSKEK